MTMIAEPAGQKAPAEPVNPWKGFSIEPKGDQPSIGLQQIDETRFRLTSTIRYNGPTGLKGLTATAEKRLRSADPRTVRSTDLASVPKPLRWWINTYGLHTPAILIHDRFIGTPEKDDPGRPQHVSEQDIDLYMRFMLAELGVPLVKRWLMWSAVATRTRLNSGVRRKVFMYLWAAFAVAGSISLVVGAATGNWLLVIAAGASPIPASLLWGRHQALAGLMIAYFGVPLLGPPAVLAFTFKRVYKVAESMVKRIEAIRHIRFDTPRGDIMSRD